MASTVKNGIACFRKGNRPRRRSRWETSYRRCKNTRLLLFLHIIICSLEIVPLSVSLPRAWWRYCIARHLNSLYLFATHLFICQNWGSDTIAEKGGTGGDGWGPPILLCFPCRLFFLLWFLGFLLKITGVRPPAPPLDPPLWYLTRFLDW